MTVATGLRPDDRAALTDLLPLLRRAADLDPAVLARVRLARTTATALVRLPFGVLVSRTVTSQARPAPVDVTVAARDAIDWVASDRSVEPAVRDVEWRAGLPPPTGWQRVDSIPDDVIRRLVRSGARALTDAAAREGVPGAQPRAQVADALLDSVVLTVRDDRATEAPVSLRAVSALTRMGFLPHGGVAHVDVAGRWIRIVAEHGTVYLERPGRQLQLR